MAGWCQPFLRCTAVVEENHSQLISAAAAAAVSGRVRVFSTLFLLKTHAAFQRTLFSAFGVWAQNHQSLVVVVVVVVLLCISPVLIWLSLSQVLSDESIRVSDLEVWVPDASGVLALSTNLLYDDAPWLAKKVACSTPRRARVTLLCCVELC